MDANRFDTIARAVGSSADRRGLFKAAGSAFGLVGLSALANGVMADDVVIEVRSCNEDKDCKGDDVCEKRRNKENKCVECNNNKDCKNNQKCKKHKCKNK
jgi:hypothetical protein